MEPQRLPFDANRIRVNGGISDTGSSILPLEVNANGGLDVNIVGGLPDSIPQNFQSGTTTATDTNSYSLISAVASNKLYLTQITIMNTGSTTTYVNIQDGSNGTTKYVAPAPAGGGSVISLPTPIPSTLGNGWYFAAGSSNSTLYVSATAYASTI